MFVLRCVFKWDSARMKIRNIFHLWKSLLLFCLNSNLSLYPTHNCSSHLTWLPIAFPGPNCPLHSAPVSVPTVFCYICSWTVTLSQFQLSLTLILISKASDLTVGTKIGIAKPWGQADGLNGPGWLCTVTRAGTDLQQGWGRERSEGKDDLPGQIVIMSPLQML